MDSSTTYMRAQSGLDELMGALCENGHRAEIAQELSDIGIFMLSQDSAGLPPQVFAYDGDAVAGLRFRIDERLKHIAADSHDLDGDPILGLIADLISYRIALWSQPVAYELTDPILVLGEEGRPDEVAAADHVHDGEGRCIKSRTGVFCPSVAPALTVVVNL